MEQIGQMMNTPLSGGVKNFKLEPLEFCEVCGEAIKLREPLFNKTVGAKCRCFREKQEKEQERQRQYEAEISRKTAKANSYMDEKALSQTFETLAITDDNRRYIEAAKKYCGEKWEENFKNNRGLLFYGGTGRGKTTLACCIANRLTDSGIDVKVVSVNGIIQRVKDSFSKNGTDGETVIKGEIKAAALLILDDLGAENKTDWSTTLIYELIDERYRSSKPTIITTNLTLKQLKEHLTDSYGVPRAFDRLTECLTPIEFQCRNFRGEKAKQTKANFDFFE